LNFESECFRAVSKSKKSPAVFELSQKAKNPAEEGGGAFYWSFSENKPPVLLGEEKTL